jgi:hypothetical protein
LQEDVDELGLTLSPGVEGNYSDLVILRQYPSHCAGRLCRFVRIGNPIDSRVELGLPLLSRQLAVVQLAIFELALRATPDEQNNQNHKNEHQVSRGCDDLGIFQGILNQIGLQ